ncbi:MAG: radical SAM/SPASM domain-containing protein [Anaerolineae bacterium]
MSAKNTLNTWRVRLKRAAGSPGYVSRELRNRARRLHFFDYRFRRDGQAMRPDFLTFILTYQCNLRCKHCFLYEAEFKKDTLAPFTFNHGEQLSLQDWQRLVDDVAHFKPHIQLVGGEPFMYRGALDLIRHIKSRGLTCAVNSNGFFTPDMAEDLVKARLDWLTLSLDGPREAHTAMRINPRSYDRVMETVAAVRAARQRLGRTTPILSFNTVITDLTYTRLTEMVALAEEVGVDQLEFQGLMFTSPGIERRQGEVMRQLFNLPAASAEGFENDCGTGIEVDRLVDELGRLDSAQHNGLAIRFHPAGLLQDPHGYHSLNDSFTPRCTAPWREMQILPNGDVSACWGLPELRVGNVARHGFEAVWNSPQMTDFRRKLKTEGLFPACARCCRRDW